MRDLRISELFYAPQGEGSRAGEPSIFIRFQGCNMQCDLEPGPLSPGGFFCDTDFSGGRKLTFDQLLAEMRALTDVCKWIVLTGGEPALQLTAELVDAFHEAGYKLAIESNGTIALPPGLDHICISPKTAEHCVKQLTATEIKYVRAHGQALPKPACEAPLKYVSPAWGPDPTTAGFDRRNLDWCLKLILENPDWRLSTQQHKLWRVR